MSRNSLNAAGLPPLAAQKVSDAIDAVGAVGAANVAALDGLTPATLTTEAGAGITNNTGGGSYSSAITRIGNLITTQIFIDVDGLDSSTTDLDIIGFDEATDLPAHLGQVTDALNGVIYAGTMTCLETPAGGVADIDLYAGLEATGVFDANFSAITERILLTSGGAWSAGLSKQLTGIPLGGDYLYLTGGAAGTAAEYTAGQFVITLHGMAV